MPPEAKTGSRSLTLLALSLALAVPSSAQDWPEWRGPGREGIAALTTPRAAWPKTLAQAWKVGVGIGHSSPLVVGSRVYLFAREGEEEVLRAFELASGKSLWRQAYKAPYTMNGAASEHGKGPKSTPVVASGRIFTLGISGILTARDASKGRLLWRHDWSDRFKAGAPLFGAALSPVVDRDRVIAHLGGQDDGALFAFDVGTGATRWSFAGDGPGYASPIVAPIAGVRQVVTLTQKHVVGLSAANGKLLWKIPFTTPYEQNAVTPVVLGDVVVYSGLDNGVSAVRVVRRGAEYATEPVWENRDVSLYMSSPVVVGEVLYGLSHKQKGQFFALDVRTGRTLWLSEGRQGDNAALVAGAGALFMLTTDASLIVAEPSGDAFSVVRTYNVAETPTWAHPALAGNALVVKELDSLALWRIGP